MAITYGVYDENGYLRTTEVSGSSLTGVYAADGSINIVIDDALDLFGIYHPCGALRVNSTVGSTVYDGKGRYYLNHLMGSPKGGAPSVVSPEVVAFNGVAVTFDGVDVTFTS